MRRIAFLCRGLLLAEFAVLMSAQPSAPPGDFRIALTGDSMIQGRLSIYDEPEYLQLIHRIQSADVAFANFEMLVHNFEYSPAATSGGIYLQAFPFVLDEMKWAGFRIFSVANNHAYDYGADGLLSTLRYFDKASLVYAGAGENLARARAPGYFDTKRGRVALVACASTFSPAGPAGEQRVDLKGRPGVSPLRVRTTYTVEPATMDVLRRLPGLGRGGGAQGELSLLGATFKTGDKPGVITEPNPKDMAGILAGIREARRMADWVVVSIHAHESAPGNNELPAAFLVPFAHAAIDEGADVFVGHGPHVLRGIEIYKGKPIFYSMGNFIFQNDLVPFQPQDEMNLANLPLTAVAADFYDNRDGTTYSGAVEQNTRSFPASKEYWESMMAEAVFNRKRELQAIELFPITLGFGKTRPQRGRPVLATPEEARTIIERVAKLSIALGTKVTFEDGKGIVTLEHPSN
jgi:poly-gamma-glutamate capsule biosynthesis protein CapA/YwtB (metallophosphatase superfamily)